MVLGKTFTGRFHLKFDDALLERDKGEAKGHPNFLVYDALEIKGQAVLPASVTFELLPYPGM